MTQDTHFTNRQLIVLKDIKFCENQVIEESLCKKC